jgi:predicted lipoprotein with Yx(FWY)xxD motif
VLGGDGGKLDRPPQMGNGPQAALPGTVRRTDGTTQVTYAGHPLYYFSGDQKRGEIDGEGSQVFGGGWDLVSPAGVKVEKPGR